MGKIISPMRACWTTLPLRRVVSLRFRDVAAAAPYDDRELAFVVQVRGNARPKDRLPVSDLGVSKPGKNGRVLRRRPARFCAVGFVVEADAQDLVRIGNHR